MTNAKTLKVRVEELESAFGRLQHNVHMHGKKIDQLQEDVKPISPQYCEQMEERHKTLTEAFHLAIHKIHGRCETQDCVSWME